MGAATAFGSITVVCCTFKTTARDGAVRRGQREKAVGGVTQILEANLLARCAAQRKKQAGRKDQASGSKTLASNFLEFWD